MRAVLYVYFNLPGTVVVVPRVLYEELDHRLTFFQAAEVKFVTAFFAFMLVDLHNGRIIDCPSELLVCVRRGIDFVLVFVEKCDLDVVGECTVGNFEMSCGGTLEYAQQFDSGIAEDHALSFEMLLLWLYGIVVFAAGSKQYGRNNDK
ncbi:MAG: hypothetical protein CL946_10030 [Ectothiorhodospiraceae bacterium]|nr:hypothetical protein [Ectothiorhodospiraceae bacterium]